MRITLALLLAGCPAVGDGTSLEVERTASIDRLFRQDPRWLGTASTTSLELGDDRTLWLFGESFISTNGTALRSTATIVPNSIALMVGRDVADATMDFAYGDPATPTGFFDTVDAEPLGGTHLPDGSALVFLGERGEPVPGGFGSRIESTHVVKIRDLTGSPRDWTSEPVFTFRDVELGCSVRVGDHVVALIVDGNRNGSLVRWSDDALIRGDLTDREVWNGSAWATDGAIVVVPEASSRCSLFPQAELSWDAVTWVYSASQADGTIAYREAARLEGPYSTAQTMSMPTVEGDELAYGGRVHELTDDDLRLVTFLVTSLEPGELFDPARDDELLWPRVGRAVVRIAVE